MTIPGNILEDLADLVNAYNKGLNLEKEGVSLKNKARDTLLDVLKRHQCHEVEVADCRLLVKPWSRESIGMDKARMLLPAELLAQLVSTSTGISLDVRPLRRG